MPLVSDNQMLVELSVAYPELTTFWLQAPQAAFWLIETQGNGTEWISEQMAAQLGYQPKELSNWRVPFLQIVHPEDRKSLLNLLHGSELAQKPMEIELRFLHKNGHGVNVSCSIKKTFHSKNHQPAVSGIHLKANSVWLSPGQQPEKDLNKLQLFSLFFNNSLYGAFFMMLDEPIEWNDSQDKEKLLDYVMEHQQVTEINQAMLDQYNAQREDFIGFKPLDFFPHDHKTARQLWKDLFDLGRLKVETNERTIDGQEVIFEGDYVVLYDVLGRITGHFGIQQDITERIRTQNEVKESREQLLRIAHNIPGVVYELRITKQGWFTFDFLSEEWKSMKLNLDPKSLFRDASDLFHMVVAQDIPEFTRKIQASYRERSLFDHSYRIRNADGEIRWHRSRSRPELLPNGDLIWAGLFYDHTAEHETAKTLARLALVAEKTSDIILTCRPNGAMEWANLALERLLGYAPDACMGQNFFELASGPDSEPNALKKLWHAIEMGHEVQETLILYHAHGKPGWFNVQITPISQHGNHHHAIAVMHQLDELIEKQTSLQRLVDVSSDQNKRLQNFAYIVSHNIRSHAANISSLIELLETAENPEDASHFQVLLRKSSEQLDETIMHLNDVISINTELSTSFVPIPVKSALQRALEPLKQKIRNNQAQIRLHVPEHARVIAIPAYLESIAFNLISNAIKYHKPGSPPVVDVFWEEKSDHQLLRVKDRGLGIDLVRFGDRMFNMYQTFHRMPDSKGIGLFLVRNQVEAMGGEIGVKSRPNEGATFWVKFPNRK